MRVARGVYVRPKENRFVGKVPPGAFEIALRADYEAMQSVGMFMSTPPAFEDILLALSNLEKQLNKR
jgi:hypothetical protein